MTRVRSSLSGLAASGFGPDDTARSEAMCREAWLSHGILVVRVEEVAVGWAERQLLRNLGTRLFGKRQVEP